MEPVVLMVGIIRICNFGSNTPTETILFYGNSFNGKVDIVQVYIQDQDRSDHPKGISVIGTVAKNPVADWVQS